MRGGGKHAPSASPPISIFEDKGEVMLNQVIYHTIGDNSDPNFLNDMVMWCKAGSVSNKNYAVTSI